MLSVISEKHWSGYSERPWGNWVYHELRSPTSLLLPPGYFSATQKTAEEVCRVFSDYPGQEI